MLIYVCCTTKWAMLKSMILKKKKKRHVQYGINGEDEWWEYKWGQRIIRWENFRLRQVKLMSDFNFFFVSYIYLLMTDCIAGKAKERIIQYTAKQTWINSFIYIHWNKSIYIYFFELMHGPLVLVQTVQRTLSKSIQGTDDKSQIKQCLLLLYIHNL